MISYTKLQCFLTLFLLCCVNLGYNAIILGLHEGDICRYGNGENSNHICRTLEKCPVANGELVKKIGPPICSYNGNTTIVCCPPKVPKSYSASEMCSKYSELIYFKKNYHRFGEDDSDEEYYLTSDCNEANPLITSRTIAAEPKEFPHMALLGYRETPDNNTSWYCGGSLISNRFVLTAAHCEKPSAITTLETIFTNMARLGELDFSSVTDDTRPTDYRIVQRIIHPNYKPPSLYHNIALFRLERDVDFSAYVRPVCLNTDITLTPPSTMVTGWGKSASDRGVLTSLSKVRLNTISAEECDKSFSNMVNKINKLAKGIDENSMLCTNNSKVGNSICRGYGGGPIQIKHDSYKCMYSQIGIVSFAVNICGQEGSSAVFTRVSNYISWIERIVWPKM